MYALVNDCTAIKNSAAKLIAQIAILICHLADRTGAPTFASGKFFTLTLVKNNVIKPGMRISNIQSMMKINESLRLPPPILRNSSVDSREDPTMVIVDIITRMRLKALVFFLKVTSSRILFTGIRRKFFTGKKKPH